MNLFLSLVFLFGSLFANGVNGADSDMKCDTVKLDRKVYSSSYLQKNIGPLSTLKSGVDYYSPLESPPNVYFPEKVIANRFSQSLMSRFSQARKQVLNKEDNKVEQTFNDFHVPHAPSWEGFCHQWSTAALDPQIAKLLKGNRDIICGDVLFSSGELRELFTASVNGEWLEKLHGKKREKPLTTSVAKALSELGVDDFDANDFHNAVKENLKNKKGFVFDVDSGSEIWNQPAYASTSCEKIIDPKNLTFEEFKSMPIEYLDSKDEKIGKLLSEERQQEFLFLFKARFDDPESEISEEEILSLDKSLGKNGKTFFQNRIENQKMLFQSFKEGKVQFSPDLKVRKIQNKVTYGVEGAFASSAQPKETKSYDYLVIENGKGEVLGSKWLTPAGGRPDFLWVPSHENSETELSQDLKKLMKFCKGGESLNLNPKEAELAGQLYLSALNNAISEEEAVKINKMFEDLSEGEKQKVKLIAKRYLDLPGTTKIISLFK